MNRLIKRARRPFYNQVGDSLPGSASEFGEKPGPGPLPVAHHALGRDLQHFRCFLDAQSSEESKLDDLCFARVDFSKLIQREWYWTGAEREFKRAIELNPDSGDAPGYYSWFLPIMGRVDEAVAEAKRGLQIDPLSTGLNGNLVLFLCSRISGTKRSNSCVPPSTSIQIIGSITISWAGRMSKRGDFRRLSLP